MPRKKINYNTLFGNKFKPAYKALSELERRTKQQEGFWIFTSHAYSDRELLASPLIKKVYSVTQKIGSDVSYWLENSSMPSYAQTIYNNYRWDLETRMGFVIRAIQYRDPTWWDNAKGAVWRVVNKIMGNLPTIIRGFIPHKSRLEFLPGPEKSEDDRNDIDYLN